jgi:hypothetical protein
MVSTTARPGLPVVATVREAFASVLANWWALVRIFWAWMAILFGALALMLRWTLTLYSDEASPLTGFVMGLLCIVVAFLSFASTAVAWHRLLLLGEQPPALYLRVVAPVPRYLLQILLLTLITILIMIPIMLVASVILAPLFVILSPSGPGALPSLGRELALTLVGVLLTLPALLLIARLSTSLPGIAVGRPMTLSQAMELTRGNSWQLVGGTLLVSVPAYVVGFLFEVLLPQNGGLLVASLTGLAVPVVLLVVVIVVNVLCAIAAISFLSLSYRFFAGTPQPTALQPQSS